MASDQHPSTTINGLQIVPGKDAHPSPGFPGGSAGGPKLIEKRVLADGVHRLPKIGVLVSDQLTIGRQTLQGLAFQNGIRVSSEIWPKRDGVENKESTIDETSGGLRLFVEMLNERACHLHLSETPGRTHRGHRGDLAVLPVKLNQLADVDIRHSVAISEAELILSLQIAANCYQPATGAGKLPRLGERNAPVLFTVRVRKCDGAFGAELHRNVGGHRSVIEEEFLDQPTFVAEAKDEFFDAVSRIALHDVPNDRFVADGQQRLWEQLVGIANSRALTPTEDHHFHGTSTRSMMIVTPSS